MCIHICVVLRQTAKRLDCCFLSLGPREGPNDYAMSPALYTLL